MFLAGEPDGMPLRVSEPQSYGWAGAQAATGALVALYPARGDRPRRSGRRLGAGLGRGRDRACAGLLRHPRNRAHAGRRLHDRPLDPGRALSRVLAVPRRLAQFHLLRRRRRPAHQRAAGRLDARARRRARAARRHRLGALRSDQGEPGRGRCPRGAGAGVLRRHHQARIPHRDAPARDARLSGFDRRRHRHRSAARGARLLRDRRGRRRQRNPLRQLRGDRRRAPAAALCGGTPDRRRRRQRRAGGRS